MRLIVLFGSVSIFGTHQYLSTLQGLLLTAGVNISDEMMITLMYMHITKQNRGRSNMNGQFCLG